MYICEEDLQQMQKLHLVHGMTEVHLVILFVDHSFACPSSCIDIQELQALFFEVIIKKFNIVRVIMRLKTQVMVIE